MGWLDGVVFKEFWWSIEKLLFGVKSGKSREFFLDIRGKMESYGYLTVNEVLRRATEELAKENRGREIRFFPPFPLSVVGIADLADDLGEFSEEHIMHRTGYVLARDTRKGIPAAVLVSFGEPSSEAQAHSIYYSGGIIAIPLVDDAISDKTAERAIENSPLYRHLLLLGLRSGHVVVPNSSIYAKDWEEIGPALRNGSGLEINFFNTRPPQNLVESFVNAVTYNSRYMGERVRALEYALRGSSRLY